MRMIIHSANTSKTEEQVTQSET